MNANPRSYRSEADLLAILALKQVCTTPQNRYDRPTTSSGWGYGASAGFYGQPGFAAPSHDEGFALLERDSIALQFNVSDPTDERPETGCRVCSLYVTNSEVLYQQYLPTGALRSPIQTTDWGTKGFWLCDPFHTILIFEESIPEEENSTQQRE